MTARLKVRAPHLGESRPVPARRAVGGPVRLLVVADVRERAAFVAATGAGVLAVVLAVVGAVVLWLS